jgi:beta-glucosidase
MAAQQPPKHKGAAPWMDTSLSPDRRADLVAAEMTLDEKVGIVHGFERGAGATDPAVLAVAERANGGAGFAPGIPHLDLPDLQLADAAVGVALAAERGRYATPLPSTVALAATWDLELGREFGALIGRELRDQGYNVSLGGGVNLMREPRNGRNFEYHGEDPILAGTMVGQIIRGEQDQHVVGDIKHYALNDQERGREVASVVFDKRVMRETDLLAFEIGVRNGKPGMVMCSYNRVDGVYACEHDYLLNDLLKRTWGFKGWVVSDWGATHSTAKAALAGLDQEMPGDTFFGAALKRAVEAGDVPMARLDDMVHRILRTEFAAGIIDDPPVMRVPDVFRGFEVAQRVAEQGSVLLKNAGGLLPLSAGAVRSLAVIGSHADVGVLSGSGSAQVDPPGGNVVPPGHGRAWDDEVWHPSAPLRAIRAKVPHARVMFDGGTDPAAAAAIARAADVAVVFVNQPMSEGRDAASLALPARQDALVDAVAAVNPRTVVVLETGGPVAMPWIDRVGAALEVWYPGIRGAEAIANLLFGDANPAGKLPMTFARSDADLPQPRLPGSDLAPGAGSRQLPPFDIRYPEGLKVGYKWFDAEGKTPLFPFGHGLSYTTFAYAGLVVRGTEVTFAVTNTGGRPGAEVAQVYVALPPAAGEPPHRLVAWQTVRLGPGESTIVTLTLDPRFLSVFDVRKDAWALVPGDYTVLVGPSSRDLPLSAGVRY